jgi:two-component system, NarL family, sensor histidine kinase UhpB
VTMLERRPTRTTATPAAGFTIIGGTPPSQGAMTVETRTAKPDRSVGRRAQLPGISLFTRVFVTNAAVLAAAVIFLALSPVTVSHPVGLREVVVLVAGLCLILVLNLILFRRAFAPLERLTELMWTVDVLQPGRRIPVSRGDVEVAKLTSAFNEMLGRLEEERRQSARASLSAQEGERSRVARELHDEIGQSLTALVLELDVLTRVAPEDVRQRHADVREAARASLEEVRQIAQRLRPEALDELGLPAALAALADRVSGHGGLRVASRLDRRLPPLAPEAELVIYRVAQESLTNTLRHADASVATLTLRSDAEGVTLQVHDDGRGLDGSRPGAGIQGMRERALLAGASLEIRTRAEGGAEVRLEVPAEPE